MHSQLPPNASRLLAQHPAKDASMVDSTVTELGVCWDSWEYLRNPIGKHERDIPGKLCIVAIVYAYGNG